MIFDSLEPVANQVDSCQRMLLERTGISAIFSNSPSPLSLLGIGFTIAFGKNLLPCCMVGLPYFFSQSYCNLILVISQALAVYTCNLSTSKSCSENLGLNTLGYRHKQPPTNWIVNMNRIPRRSNLKKKIKWRMSLNIFTTQVDIEIKSGTTLNLPTMKVGIEIKGNKISSA